MLDNEGAAHFIEARKRAQGIYLLRTYASLIIFMLLSLAPVARAGSSASVSSPSSQDSQATTPQAPTPSTLASMSAYVGRTVKSIDLPGVSSVDHFLPLLPQKAGQPLDRDQVRDSIRILFATGRFADIQAEVTPSGPDVLLTFTTSLNFFVGAVDVEGAPAHPNHNQIVNATKLQLGELHTLNKLDRGLQNVRQLMQENGYYRARVTAESTSNPATQQVDILFHISPGEAAKVGEVKVTGTSGLSSAEVQSIAHLTRGDRLTAARVRGSLQRLRKRFQKQSRALAQVSIADQPYHPETNTVDFTFKIDPGPVVV